MKNVPVTRRILRFRLGVLFLLLPCITFAGDPTPTTTDSAYDAMKFEASEIIVKFKEGTPQAIVQSLLLGEGMSILYEMDLQFEGRKDLARTEVTDDPIREFQNWTRSDEFKEAEAERDAAVEAAREGFEADEEAVRSRREFEEKKTTPAPSGERGTLSP